MSFLKKFLKGEKELLKQQQLVIMPKLPKVNEIDVKSIWEDIKQDKTIQKYFPNSFIIGKRIPGRVYMFTVSSN